MDLVQLIGLNPSLVTENAKTAGEQQVSVVTPDSSRHC